MYSNMKWLAMQQDIREEGWREGIEEGRRIGIEEGRRIGRRIEIEEGRRKGIEERVLLSAENLYENGFSVEEIGRLLKIDVAKLSFLDKKGAETV